MGFFSTEIREVAPAQTIVPTPPPPSAEETKAFQAATESLFGQQGLEQEQLGIQRQLAPNVLSLQQAILQKLMETFTPQGIQGLSGLVSDAFAEPARAGREAIEQRFQNAGFDPLVTTPAAQERGRFEGTLASAKSQAILDQLFKSMQLGFEGPRAFVPTPASTALPSLGAGTNIGGTLGNIRAATFRPTVIPAERIAEEPIGGDILKALIGAGGQLGSAAILASDVNIKENIEQVEGALEKLESVPVSTWNYIEKPDTKHIGPMAQDFNAAFGVGDSDKAIHSIDLHGVALAAIKELYEKVKRLEEGAE